MGEYYIWANVDKKEYLSPYDFDLGNKLHESMRADNPLLNALEELLHAEWKSDRIIFLGDESPLPKHHINCTIDVLVDDYNSFGDSGYLIDAIDEHEIYRNISCQFRFATNSRSEIEYYIELFNKGETWMTNEYGVDISDPFYGLFTREGKAYKYIINHSKKIYFSINEIKVYEDCYGLLENVNPLPLLMCYGRVTDPGIWCGDIIGVSNEVEPSYSEISELHLK